MHTVQPLFNGYPWKNDSGHSEGACTEGPAVLSVRFEVGVCPLLVPAGAVKRGPKAHFPLVENAGIQPRFAREYPPELQREPDHTESTGPATQ